jgi:ribosomal protein L29
MTFPAYKEINALNEIEEVEKEIILSQKFLFDLRMSKQASPAKMKPHLFVHTKRRIAQLHFKKSQLQK